MISIGTPLSSTATKVLFLGSGELGKEQVRIIRLPRDGFGLVQRQLEHALRRAEQLTRLGEDGVLRARDLRGDLATRTEASLLQRGYRGPVPCFIRRIQFHSL